MIQNSQIAIALLTCLISSSQALDSCTTNPSISTLYDSFLDPQIYYAQFQKGTNSYFKIPNPFNVNGLTLNTMSVVFWAKIPQMSIDGISQSGTFIDCSDTGVIRLSNDSLNFGVSNSSNGTSASAIAQIFKSSLSQMQQWNNYAVIFSSKVLYIYFNGVYQGSKASNFTSLVTSPTSCTIANSQILSDPINAYIRHLLFSKAALNSNSNNIQNLIHHITLPTDTNALGYFQFSSTFNYEQTYLHSVRASTDYASSNVFISSNTEQEFVCYCTGTYPHYMQLNGNQQVNPFVLKNTSVDTKGVLIDFTVFLTMPSSSQTSDILIFSLNKYVDVYIASSLSVFRVDLYDSKQTVTTQNLMTYSLRYNFWTQYTLNITSSLLILYVDGVLAYKTSLTQTFPSNVTTFTISSQTALSYMISSLAVRNSKGVNGLSLNLTRNAMNASFITQIIQSGSISWGQSNAFCPMSNANQTIYWNGLSCIDNRLTPYFQGGANSSISTSSLLQSQLYSSRKTMTIELWIRDMNSLVSTRQVLLENSQDGINSLVQISITTGSSSAALRSITCSPQITSSIQLDLTLSLVSTYNIWTHFTCISSGSDSSLTALLYNPATLKTINQVSQGNAFLDQTAAIQTSLGSNILGSTITKFQGYIKQLRIWNTARTLYQIQVFRYQVISSSNTDILHNFMLNDQFSPFSVQGVGQDFAVFAEQGFVPDISYLSDKDLVICQPGFYYNGQCCQVFDLSTTNFTIVYNQVMNQIQIGFQSTSLINSNLNSSMRVNYSLIAVGNNLAYNNLGDQIDTFTYLSNFFIQNNLQYFAVQANLVNPAAYSLTIQAIIYSDYDPTTYVVRTQTFVLTCPNIWLYVLPNQVITDSTQIVSESSLDTTPTINALVSSQCYSAGTNGVLTLQTLDPTSLKWSWNLTSLVFTNIYSIASDSMSVTIASTKAKSQLVNSNAYQLITVNYTYGSKKSSVSSSIKLYYSPSLKITNSLALPLTSTVDMVQGLSSSSIALDLSSFGTSNSSYSILYQMACPSTLFTSAALYNQLCSISNTGQFSLQATSINSIGGTTPYFFNIYIILNGTSILQNYTLVLYVYLDGTANDNCPGITMNSNYVFNQFISSSLAITTNSYLYCGTSFYNVLSANWTAVDDKTGTNYTSILSFGTQQFYTTAYVYQTSTAKVLAGAIVDVTLNLTLQNVSTQAIITDQYSTQIYFSQNQLTPKVVAQNAKGSSLNIANGVNFTEPSFVLNAQSSFDPDNSSAALTYSWTCPDQINLYYSCSSLVSTNTYTLSLTQYQRAKSQVAFNTNYTFTLTVSSVDNPYKPSQSISVQVFFNPPSKSDILSQVSSTCDSMSAPLGQGGIYYLNSTYPKLLRYDILNYSSVSYNVSFSNTSLVCSKGTVVEQRLLFYVFDAGFYSATAVPTLIFAQDTSSPLVNSSTLQISLSVLFGNMLALNPSQFYQSNIYWYTVRQVSSGLQTVYLNIDTVYFSKTPAQLQAQIATNVLTVDKYSDLYIDASSSYDPEGQKLNYFYKWTCPGKQTTCNSQNSSMLKVTPFDRQQAAANVNKVSYSYSVIMSDGIRNSPPANASVTITQLDSYAQCLTSYTNTDNFNDNYWPSNNNTVYVQYNQSQAIQVMINASAVCQYASVSSTTYSQTLKTTTIYWVIDSTYSNVVYITNAMALKGLKTNALSTLFIQQYFVMGSDTSTPYNTSSYINVALNSPDLVPSVKGQPVAVMTNANSTNVLYISSNQSSDSLKTTLTSYWNCPDYLGGTTCQSSSPNSVLSFNFTYLSSLASDITLYYEESHRFILTLVSSDKLRLTQTSYYVYFASQGLLAKSAAVNCGITMLNDNGSHLAFSSLQTFSFACPNSVLTNNITAGQTLVWSINGLTVNTDYFQNKTFLYLKAYSLQSLQGADLNEMVVSLLISPNMTNPMKKSYKIMLPYLQMGSVSITSQSPSNSVNAYSQLYQLNFNGFSSSQYSGIQFQLRAYSKLYTANQIVFPIKQFSPYIINTLYGAFSVPYASTLKVDFFDMNFNYMGTYNLFNNAFSSIVLGSYSQTAFETALYSITTKNSSFYQNTNQAKLAYEVDIYSIKQLAESVSNSIVSVSDASYYSTYRNQILVYLISNFITPLSYFSSSSTTYDYQSREVIEKNVIYILNVAFSKSNALTNSQLNSLLTILDTITNDYSMITADGDEQEVMRQLLIGIFETMQSQLNSTNGTTAQNTKLTAITNRVVGNDTKGLTAGNSNSYISGGSFREVLVLQTNKSSSSQSYDFQNQISSNEGVVISNQSYLTTLGISSLETTFQSSSNSSSPVSTIIYINAYDKSSSRLDISFNSSDQTYIDSGLVVQLQFQATSSYITLFQNANQYTPVCSYYDTTAGSWSTYGVQLASYDSSTGIVTCTTSHFSQFSIDYASQTPSSTGNQGVNSNGIGNGTNSTNGTYPTDKSYFQGRLGYFIAICVLTFFTVTVTVIFSIKCTRTKVDNRMPYPNEFKNNFKFCEIYKATLLLHHSLISALVGPKKGSIYLIMPQYNQMIFVHVYFFMTCLLVEFIMEHKSTSQWSRVKVFKVDLLIFFVFYGIKSFAYSANYYLYYRNYPLKPREEKPKELGSVTEHQSLNENKREDKIASKNQFEIQNEGGSDEDNGKQNSGVTSTRPHQNSRPHQQKLSNRQVQDREPSIDDVDLDEIDIQIEHQSEYAFKKNLNKGASGGVGQHQSFTRDEYLQSPAFKNSQINTDVKSAKGQKIKMDTSQDPSLGQQRNQEQANSGRAIMIVDMESQRQFQEDGPQINNGKQESSSGPNMSLVEQEQDATKEQQIMQATEDDNKPPQPKNKCMKTCGTVTKILFLYFKMIVTLLFIYMLPQTIDVHHFVRSIYGILGIYEFLYEPLGFAIFSIIIKNAKNPMSIGCRIASTILFGNPHPNMILGVLYSLNNNNI